jgi:hypothetical protein
MRFVCVRVNAATAEKFDNFNVEFPVFIYTKCCVLEFDQDSDPHIFSLFAGKITPLELYNQQPMYSS